MSGAPREQDPASIFDGAAVVVWQKIRKHDENNPAAAPLAGLFEVFLAMSRDSGIASVGRRLQHSSEANVRSAMPDIILKGFLACARNFLEHAAAESREP